MTRQFSRILVTGALGQIGSELTEELRVRYGRDNVVASDIRSGEKGNGVTEGGPWELLDVTDGAAVGEMIGDMGIDAVFHMAAILSATGEKNPQLCWKVNMDGTMNILEAGRAHGVSRIIIPSSIAAFGPETPRDGTPQETVLKPRTMYGVTKVSGELVCDYYVRKYGLDVRGLRYPGIISSETLP
ncbi:MAG: NAD-dependent epimerase/dehydratase family protein, partial [Candidatus Brocadiia bacterium]